MDQLRDEARRQGKPFGLLFDNIEGGFTHDRPRIGQRLQRAAERRLSHLHRWPARPSSCAASISSARRWRRSARLSRPSDKIDVFNGVCGAESGGVPVSASSPALLVSEVEVQKKSQSQETLPILPAPPVADQRKVALKGDPADRARYRWHSGFALVSSLVLVPPSRSSSAQDSPTLSAMQDEMQRSMAELRMKGEPAPYYIDYE